MRTLLLLCLLYAGGTDPATRWQPRESMRETIDLTGYTITGETEIILDGRAISLSELGKCDGATVAEAVVDTSRKVIRKMVLRSRQP